ncbi:MAG: pseudouridine synthase [Gemmatimonadota bacterium]
MPPKGRRGPPPTKTNSPIRLQSYLAKCGVASRRASEELIRDGRVTVNGRVAELGSSVDPSADIVRLDRKIVKPKTTEWVAIHKPRGYVTTRDDPSGRKTVYDLLPEELHHLFHVGRLDRDSSGLLLLTNDGQTANRLLHPRYGTVKEYRADVQGEPSTPTLRRLVEGIELEDGTAHALSVESRGESAPGVFRLLLQMEEGRNREVRRMLEAAGHPVERLFRRTFGPIEVGNLRPGKWRRLTQVEISAIHAAGKVVDGGKPEAEEGRGPRSGKRKRGKVVDGGIPPRGGAAGESAPRSGKRGGGGKPRRPEGGGDARERGGSGRKPRGDEGSRGRPRGKSANKGEPPPRS